MEMAHISFKIVINYGDSKHCGFAGQYALTVYNLLIGCRNLGGTQHNPYRKGKVEEANEGEPRG